MWPTHGGKNEMLRTNRVTIWVALALVVALAGTAYAQAFGRVVFIFKDDEGKPVEGVEVTATSTEINTYREEKTSNKKGRVVISMTDATRVYDFHIEHGAFPSQDISFSPDLQATTTREVVLSKAPEPPSGAEVSGETMQVFSPAERVFNNGVEALRAGDVAAAREHFLQAVEKNPKMLQAHSALAGVYLEEGDFASALEAADRVIAVEPENSRAIRFRYEAYKGLGDDENAAKTLKQLQKLAPGGDTIKMIFNEGVAATKLGDLKSAKERFLEVLQLDENFKEAIGALGVIFIKEGDFANAVQMAEKMLTLDPEHLQAKKIRYDAYRALGDTEKAKEAMKDLAAADPTVLISQFYNAGVKAFENGDTEVAKQNFEQVLEIDPDHPRANYQLGITLIGSGDTAKAKTHLERFLAVAPDDPEAATARDMLQYLE